MTTTLDQSASLLNLQWTVNDPVSMAVLITGAADWAGTYVVESVNAAVAAMTVAVVAGAITGETFTTGAGSDCKVTFQLADSTGVAIGSHPWAMQQVGGVTRLAGLAIVIAGGV